MVACLVGIWMKQGSFREVARVEVYNRADISLYVIAYLVDIGFECSRGMARVMMRNKCDVSFLAPFDTLLVCLGSSRGIARVMASKV